MRGGREEFRLRGPRSHATVQRAADRVPGRDLYSRRGSGQVG